MREPILHRGRFWSADDPYRQADGKVIIDSDGRVTLITDGFFRDQNDDQDDGLFSTIGLSNGNRLIEGQTISEHVKLSGCFVKAQHSGMLGTLNSVTPTVEWHCNKAYIGSKYVGDEPTVIRSVEIVIPAYDEWVSGFPDIVMSHYGETQTMSYPANPTNKTSPWNLGTLTISKKIRETNVQFARYGTKTATLTASIGLIVEFEESQDIETAMKIVTALQALVTMAQGEACNRINRDFQFNANATAASFTEVASLGGRAWPTLAGGSIQREKALCVWLNSTLGVISYWMESNRNQDGRGSLTVTAIPDLPLLDVTCLSETQLNDAVAIFEDLQDRTLLPANEAWHDEVRQELDQRLLNEVLGLDERAVDQLDVLRRQWCSEPTVTSTKKTGPPD